MRREKPGERAARVAGKRVDPAVVRALKRALGGEEEAGKSISDIGSPKGISKMPGTDTHQKPWGSMGSDYYKKAG